MSGSLRNPGRMQAVSPTFRFLCDPQSPQDHMQITCPRWTGPAQGGVEDPAPMGAPPGIPARDRARIRRRSTRAPGYSVPAGTSRFRIVTIPSHAASATQTPRTTNE